MVLEARTGVRGSQTGQTGTFVARSAMDAAPHVAIPPRELPQPFLGARTFAGMIPSDKKLPLMMSSTRLEFMEEWFDMYRSRAICLALALVLWILGLVTLTTFPIGACVMLAVGTKYFVDSRIYNNYFTTYSDYRVVVT